MKTFRSAFVAAAVGLAVLLTTACGSGTYAAKVNDITISQDQLLDELRTVAANETYVQAVESQQPVRGTGQGTFDSTFTALALTRHIYYAVIGNELTNRKLTVTDADLAAARAVVTDRLGELGDSVFGAFPKSFQDDLVRRQAELDVLTLAVAGATSADQAARAFYDANPNEFATPCAAVIAVLTQEAATAVRDRIAAGEDFAAVATAESKHPETAAKGGDLGCDVTRSGLPNEVILATFTQPVGEVGAPLQTESGFYVVKVGSRNVAPFEQVADTARRSAIEAGDDQVVAELSKIVQGSKVEINPKFGTFRKTGNLPGVVPPQSNAPTTVPSADQPGSGQPDTGQPNP